MLCLTHAVFQCSCHYVHILLVLVVIQGVQLLFGFFCSAIHIYMYFKTYSFSYNQKKQRLYPFWEEILQKYKQKGGHGLLREDQECLSTYVPEEQVSGGPRLEKKVGLENQTFK